MAIVTLRYWAAARDAAGVSEEQVTAETLAGALAAARGSETGRSTRLRAVLSRSSYLIDGSPVGTRPPESVMLDERSVIEVLPPFAGG
jgi:molybdopterin synthase sulfur carrier subunit